MNIKGFIFDLDGVIVDTAPLHFRAWRAELKKIGIDYTETENDLLKGLNRLDTLKRILMLKNKIHEFSDEDLLKIATSKNEIYYSYLNTELSEKDVFPGIKTLLEKAKKNDVGLAIASSSRNAPFILEKLKLFEMFDFIVDPSTIKNGKPAPDIFLAACNGLNIKPEAAIGFEDAVEGVKGLLKANIKTVAVTAGVKGDWGAVSMLVKGTNELEFEKIMKL